MMAMPTSTGDDCVVLSPSFFLFSFCNRTWQRSHLHLIGRLPRTFPSTRSYAVNFLAATRSLQPAAPPVSASVDLDTTTSHRLFCWSLIHAAQTFPQPH